MGQTHTRFYYTLLLYQEFLFLMSIKSYARRVKKTTKKLASKFENCVKIQTPLAGRCPCEPIRMVDSKLMRIEFSNRE